MSFSRLLLLVLAREGHPEPESHTALAVPSRPGDRLPPAGPQVSVRSGPQRGRNEGTEGRDSKQVSVSHPSEVPPPPSFSQREVMEALSFLVKTTGWVRLGSHICMTIPGRSGCGEAGFELGSLLPPATARSQASYRLSSFPTISESGPILWVSRWLSRPPQVTDLF